MAEEISEEKIEKVIDYLVEVHDVRGAEDVAMFKGGLLRNHLDHLEGLIRLCRED